MNDSSLNRRALLLAIGSVASATWQRGAHAQIRRESAQERAAGEQAFAAIDEQLAQRWTDVQSVCVVVQGRTVYEFYRDGAPDKLRVVASVEKSALSALTGVALGRGEIASVDQPVLALMPEWETRNSDPRTRAITVRHLLTMSAGFDLGSATLISGKMPPAQAWARPMAAAPGERFAYDNAIVNLLGAIIERVSGMPLPDYARRELVLPLGMAEPSYGQTLQLRTQDMARLGQLFLQQGQWDGRQIVPSDFVADATRPHTRAGPPFSMPYGFLWWLPPNQGLRGTFMASGYGGQMIWVHPPLDLVVASTSPPSADSQRRGHALEMLRGGLVSAARSVYREPRAR